MTSVIHALQTEIEHKQAQFELLIEETIALVPVTEQKAPKLGLVKIPEHALVKGDIVIDPSEKTAYVVSGALHQGKPIAIKKGGKKVIEPELAVTGEQIKTPSLRQAAQKLATKHPTRRVYVYGDATIKEAATEQPVKKDPIITAELMVEKKGFMDPGNKPKADPLQVASLKAYMKAMKAKKDIPKPSTNPHPWQSYVHNIGDVDGHQVGDDDPGNAICPKKAKKKGVV